MAKKLNKFENTEGYHRRVMTLFFVVDVGSSMAGTKIDAVNEAINNAIPEIQKLSDCNADAEIKIAVLKYSTGAEWLTPKPVDAADFKWKWLDAGGGHDLGAACDELCQKLARNEFMIASYGSFRPVIILLSDGNSTDDYQKGLAKLKANNYFKYGLTYAIAIGDDANEDVLAEFTGHKEAVVGVHTTEVLMKLIRFDDYDYLPNEVERYGRLNDDTSTKQLDLNALIQDFVDDYSRPKPFFQNGKMSSISIVSCGLGSASNIDTSVLSISPTGNFTVCKDKSTDNLLLVKLMGELNLKYEIIPFSNEIKNIKEIKWDSLGKYFDIYYDSPYMRRYDIKENEYSFFGLIPEDPECDEW